MPRSLRFRKNLYSLKSLQSAVKDFKDFGVSLEEPSARYYYVNVSFDGKESELEQLVNEFKNYVLYKNIQYENS